MALGPGSEIAGRYRLTAPLGEGGMGAVWRADHLTLGSPVAIKLIDGALVESPEALARFMREAQAAAALRSPHVVQIFDYGVEGGIPYIAMEVLDGEDLGSRLERLGVLTPEATARVLTHVARAVGKAHDLGIVHRDLKPDNIFIVRNEDDEIAKVLDFGVAKSTDTGLGSGKDSTTRTGAVIGTPQYMSPEQARGDRKVDWRSDLWALAVIAYECLVGARPFEAEGVGTLLVKICTDPIPVPSSIAPVPTGFDAWFEKATRREPDERFQSARDMIDALRGVLLGAQSVPDSGPAASVSSRRLEPAFHSSETVLARSEATTEMTASLGGAPSSSRRRSGAIVVAAVVLAGALGGAVFLARGGDRSDLGMETSVAPQSAASPLPPVSATSPPRTETTPLVVPAVEAERAAVAPPPEANAAPSDPPPVATQRRASPRSQTARKASAPAPQAESSPPPSPAPAPNRVRDIGF